MHIYDTNAEDGLNNDKNKSQVRVRKHSIGGIRAESHSRSNETIPRPPNTYNNYISA